MERYFRNIERKPILENYPERKLKKNLIILDNNLEYLLVFSNENTTKNVFGLHLYSKNGKQNANLFTGSDEGNEDLKKKITSELECEISCEKIFVHKENNSFEKIIAYGLIMSFHRKITDVIIPRNNEDYIKLCKIFDEALDFDSLTKSVENTFILNNSLISAKRTKPIEIYKQQQLMGNVKFSFEKDLTETFDLSEINFDSEDSKNFENQVETETGKNLKKTKNEISKKDIWGYIRTIKQLRFKVLMGTRLSQQEIEHIISYTEPGIWTKFFDVFGILGTDKGLFSGLGHLNEILPLLCFQTLSFMIEDTNQKNSMIDIHESVTQGTNKEVNLVNKNDIVERLESFLNENSPISKSLVVALCSLSDRLNEKPDLRKMVLKKLEEILKLPCNPMEPYIKLGEFSSHFISRNEVSFLELRERAMKALSVCNNFGESLNLSLFNLVKRTLNSVEKDPEFFLPINLKIPCANKKKMDVLKEVTEAYKKTKKMYDALFPVLEKKKASLVNLLSILPFNSVSQDGDAELLEILFSYLDDSQELELKEYSSLCLCYFNLKNNNRLIFFKDKCVRILDLMLKARLNMDLDAEKIVEFYKKRDFCLYSLTRAYDTYRSVNQMSEPLKELKLNIECCLNNLFMRLRESAAFSLGDMITKHTPSIDLMDLEMILGNLKKLESHEVTSDAANYAIDSIAKKQSNYPGLDITMFLDESLILNEDAKKRKSNCERFANLASKGKSISNQAFENLIKVVIEDDHSNLHKNAKFKAIEAITYIINNFLNENGQVIENLPFIEILFDRLVQYLKENELKEKIILAFSKLSQLTSEKFIHSIKNANLLKNLFWRNFTVFEDSLDDQKIETKRCVIFIINSLAKAKMEIKENLIEKLSNCLTQFKELTKEVLITLLTIASESIFSPIAWSILLDFPKYTDNYEHLESFCSIFKNYTSNSKAKVPKFPSNILFKLNDTLKEHKTSVLLYFVNILQIVSDKNFLPHYLKPECILQTLLNLFEQVNDQDVKEQITLSLVNFSICDLIREDSKRTCLAKYFFKESEVDILKNLLTIIKNIYVKYIEEEILISNDVPLNVLEKLENLHNDPLFFRDTQMRIFIYELFSTNPKLISTNAIKQHIRTFHYESDDVVKRIIIFSICHFIYEVKNISNDLKPLIRKFIDACQSNTILTKDSKCTLPFIEIIKQVLIKENCKDLVSDTTIAIVTQLLFNSYEENVCANILGILDTCKERLTPFQEHILILEEMIKKNSNLEISVEFAEYNKVFTCSYLSMLINRIHLNEKFVWNALKVATNSRVSLNKNLIDILVLQIDQNAIDVFQIFLNCLKNDQKLALSIKQKIESKYESFKQNEIYLNLLACIFSDKYLPNKDIVNKLCNSIENSTSDSLTKLYVQCLYHSGKRLTEKTPLSDQLLNYLVLDQFKEIESMLFSLLENLKDDRVKILNRLRRANKKLLFSHLSGRENILQVLEELKNMLLYLPKRTFFILGKLLTNELKYSEKTLKIIEIAEKLTNQKFSEQVEFQEAICSFANSILLNNSNQNIKILGLLKKIPHRDHETQLTMCLLGDESAADKFKLICDLWNNFGLFKNSNNMYFMDKSDGASPSLLKLNDDDSLKLLLILKKTNYNERAKALTKEEKFIYYSILWLRFKLPKDLKYPFQLADLSHAYSISKLFYEKSLENVNELGDSIEELLNDWLSRNASVDWSVENNFFFQLRSFFESWSKGRVNFLSYYDIETLDERFENIGWRTNKLLDIEESLDQKLGEEGGNTFSRLKDIIFNYSFSPLFKESLIEIIQKNNTAGQILKEVNKFICAEKFTLNSVDTNKEELINEFNKLNSSFAGMFESDIAQQLLKHICSGQFKSSILVDKPEIQKWNKIEIKNWTRSFKKNKFASDKRYLSEMFIVINRSLEIFTQTNTETGHGLRIAQVLACYALLNTSDSEVKGRLAEIYTGEGKTTIISVIAVIKCLQNLKVDIITSSHVLASRDSANLKEFYAIFELTCSENSDNNNYIGYGEKPCYMCDVVYGSTDNFQYDVLKHEFSMLGTRDDRKFEFCIIDEVDSLLIDESSNTAMLSSTIPFMNYLDTIFISIWYHMNHMTQDIENCIKNEIKANQILLPRFLAEFVDFKLVSWIDSAELVRRHYKEGVQYRILDGKIKIINLNTGVTYEDSRWDDGIHKFLEIKHNLRLTPENLITNYLSNLDFFIKYHTRDEQTNKLVKNGLIGLTGTLGTTKTQKLLNELYHLDFVQIPRYKYHELQIFPWKKCSASDFDHEIINSIQLEIENERAVLVICDSVFSAKNLKFLMDRQEWCKSYKIKLYIYGDQSDNHIVKEVVNSGDLIIATKLAGRGTDLKISENVKINGGLHVLVVTIPNNMREKEQFNGRTAREGLPGTSQILTKNDIEINGKSVVDVIISEREANNIDRYIENQKEFDDIKRELFQKFCKMRVKLIDNEKSKKKSIFSFSSENSAVYDENLYKKSEWEILQVFKLKALDEEWGFWVSRVNNSNKKDAKEKFDFFEERSIERFSENSVIKNSAYWVGYANELIKYLNSARGIGDYVGLAKDINSKIEWALNEAIDLEKKCSYVPYYLRAYMRLKNDENTYATFKSCLTEIALSKECVDLEKNNLMNMKSKLIDFKTEKKALKNFASSQINLKIQIVHKINILENLIQNIDENTVAIKKVNKLAHLEFDGNEIIKEKTFSEIRQLLENYSLKKRKITLYFNNLIELKDMKIISLKEDAVKLMEKVFKRQNNKSFVEIRFTDLDLKKATKLLPFTEKKFKLKRISSKIQVSLYIKGFLNIQEFEKVKDKLNKGMKHSAGEQNELILNIEQIELDEAMNKLNSIIDEKLLRVDLYFLNLVEDQSREIISHNSKFISNALIVVKNLSHEHALDIIRHAEKEISLGKFCRPKLEPFDKHVLPENNKHEVLDFKINEFKFIFVLSEREPFRIATFTTIAGLVVLQTGIASALLFAGGPVAMPIATNLFCEAGSDLFNLFSVARNKFNWKAFFALKITSYALLSVGTISSLAKTSNLITASEALTNVSQFADPVFGTGVEAYRKLNLVKTVAKSFTSTVLSKITSTSCSLIADKVKENNEISIRDDIESFLEKDFADCQVILKSILGKDCLLKNFGIKKELDTNLSEIQSYEKLEFCKNLQILLKKIDDKFNFEKCLKLMYSKEFDKDIEITNDYELEKNIKELMKFLREHHFIDHYNNLNILKSIEGNDLSQLSCANDFSNNTLKIIKKIKDVMKNDYSAEIDKFYEDTTKRLIKNKVVYENFKIDRISESVSLTINVTTGFLLPVVEEKLLNEYISNSSSVENLVENLKRLQMLEHIEIDGVASQIFSKLITVLMPKTEQDFERESQIRAQTLQLNKNETIILINRFLKDIGIFIKNLPKDLEGNIDCGPKMLILGILRLIPFSDQLRKHKIKLLSKDFLEIKLKIMSTFSVSKKKEFLSELCEDIDFWQNISIFEKNFPHLIQIVMKINKFYNNSIITFFVNDNRLAKISSYFDDNNIFDLDGLRSLCSTFIFNPITRQYDFIPETEGFLRKHHNLENLKIIIRYGLTFFDENLKPKFDINFYDINDIVRNFNRVKIIVWKLIQIASDPTIRSFLKRKRIQITSLEFVDKKPIVKTFVNSLINFDIIFNRFLLFLNFFIYYLILRNLSTFFLFKFLFFSYILFLLAKLVDF